MHAHHCACVPVAVGCVSGFPPEGGPVCEGVQYST